MCVLLENLGICEEKFCSKSTLKIKDNPFGDFIYKSKNRLFIIINSLDGRLPAGRFSQLCGEFSAFTISLQSLVSPILFKIFFLVITVYFVWNKTYNEPPIDFVLDVMKLVEFVVFTDHKLKEITNVTDNYNSCHQKLVSGVLNYVTVIMKRVTGKAYKPILRVGCKEQYAEISKGGQLLGKAGKCFYKDEKFLVSFFNAVIEEFCEQKKLGVKKK